MKKTLPVLISLVCVFYVSCSAGKDTPITGAEQIGLYKPLIEGKTIAVVANQTSMVGDVHLIRLFLLPSTGSGTWLMPGNR